jgi:peptide/nickel transport system ATP-binding protein
MTEQPLLSVRDLRTHFTADEGTTRAVDGVSFDVYAGRTLGVVGETGCGKSVTARSILRIVDKPGQIVGGEILLRHGEEWLDLTSLPASGREVRAIRGGEIGLVFQEPMASFSPVHTVGNQLTEAIRLHAELEKKQAVKRAAELLDMVGVPEPESRLGAYPWQLSGGLLQRVMIAMALAGEPQLLILDEPTTALDVITQAHVLDLVRDLQERSGLGIILITHDLGVVAQMADDVAVMYLGQVVERGPVARIFSAAGHPYTQALLESIPSRGKGIRRRLPAIAGSIPHPLRRPTGCSFHPRCRYAIADVCFTEEPTLRPTGDRHEVSCHLDDTAMSDNVIKVVGGEEVITLTERPALDGVEAAVADRTASLPPDVPDGRPLLEVRHLVKEFPVRGGQLGRARGHMRAVNNVTFDLQAGQTLALVGESGSGKTTASRCILRAVTPDSGEVLYRRASGEVIDLAQVPTKQLRSLRPEIQMIFQDPHSSLNPRMSVLHAVGEPLVINGVSDRQERTDRVEELLRMVGLGGEYLRRFPHALSGGQRQRVSIARALAMNPRLIVADEPVSALDVSVQAQILNLLLDLQERLGLTYLFVSHDLSVVRHISNRIGVMYAGELVELGDTEDVLSAPRHPYTSALLAAIPQLDPTTRAPFRIPRAKTAPGGDPQAGCQFRRRCPFAVDRCATEQPAWEEVAGRRVRCHRAAELELSGS